MILVAVLAGVFVALAVRLFGPGALFWIILATLAGGWLVKRWVEAA